MKNLFATLMFFIGLLIFNVPANAVSLSGTGCNTWGNATYLFVNEATSLAIVGGGACFVTGLTAGETAALSAVVSQAQASNRLVLIGTGASAGGGSANGLAVAMQ